MMDNRILQKKLLFLHHLVTLPEDSLAREVYEIQARLDLPGLVKECQDVLALFDITDISSYSSYQWKKIIKTKIRQKNRYELLEKMKLYKKHKYNDHCNDEFKTQSYFYQMNVHNARMQFKIKASMIPTVRMQYMNDPVFARQLWTCPDCADPQDTCGGKMDSMAHVLDCPAHEDIREDLDMESDEGVVEYFKEVVKRREGKCK